MSPQFVEDVVHAENLEEDVVRVSLSLNFKMYYKEGELVCDASSIEECEKVGKTPKEPNTLPPKIQTRRMLSPPQFQ